MNDNDLTGTYVPYDHRMDPAYEDLLRGDELQNGMIVLLDHDIVGSAWAMTNHRRNLDENNRWCTVTKLNVTERFEHGEMGEVVGKMSPLVSFIGVYADGTKMKRRYDASYTWLVKLDSIPSAEPEHGLTTFGNKIVCACGDHNCASLNGLTL